MISKELRVCVRNSLDSKTESSIHRDSSNLEEYLSTARQARIRSLMPRLKTIADTDGWSSPIWSGIEEELARKEELTFTEKSEMTTNQNTCPRCNGNRTTQYEKQVRASDEPSTVFITCLDCKNHWKIN